MLTIGLVKTVIAVGPTGDQPYGAKLAKFVVNSVNIEPAYEGKLTYISLLTGRSEDRL
jgi:hypothetical protein